MGKQLFSREFEAAALQLQLTHDFNADYAAGYEILRAASTRYLSNREMAVDGTVRARVRAQQDG